MALNLEVVLNARRLDQIDVFIRPNDSVQIARFLRSEQRVQSPLARHRDCWAPNKPTLLFAGAPTWAEYILVRLLEGSGWEARWIKNWTGGRQFCTDIGVPTPLPPDAAMAFQRIDQRAASRTGGGAWDIFAWREDDFLFLESKKYKSGDVLRPGQIAWLAAALAEGFTPEQFAVVEYDPR